MIQKDDLLRAKERTSDLRVSSPEEIREFFSNNIHLFANPDQMMPGIIDCRLCLDMFASVATSKNTSMQHILDFGCGGGNATSLLLREQKQARNLRQNEKLDMNVTLIDLSPEMLKHAVLQAKKLTRGHINSICIDIRDAELQYEEYDAILASLVLHHLRSEEQWLSVYRKLYQALKPGASLWVYDLVDISDPQVQQYMKSKYDEHLLEIADEAYRDFVFEHMRQEDTPRSLQWQLEKLKKVGFRVASVLHQNLLYAAFYATK